MENILNNYCQYLMIEKGLSINSIQSYKRDVKQFIEYIKSIGIDSFNDVKKDNISSYISTLMKKMEASSCRRKMISIKGIFEYMLDEDSINVDIT